MQIVIEPALLFGGRYELGPVIGRGGMAEVRSGRDTRLDRPVAVKLLRPEMALQPALRERFESEARLAARLIHPNVVAVFDSGEVDGVPYIVMERLPGETLQDRLAAGPLPPAEVRPMAVQVLAALRAAHDAGVLHRDIKPGNILAAAGGGWKVGDFGIAKALELDQSDQTATGQLVGTPAYLAPERFFGSAATVASDLYSLGVVLFEALAGRKPFDAAGPEAWAAAASAGFAAPSLQSVQPHVDPVLAAAVARCLERDPSARFRSAAEMSAAIAAPAGPGAADATAVFDHPAPAVAPTQTWTATPYRSDGPSRPVTQVLPIGDRIRRTASPARWIAGAALVAVVLVVVLALATGGGDHRGTGSAPTTAAPPATAAAPASGSLPTGLSRALDNLRHQVTRGR